MKIEFFKIKKNFAKEGRFQEKPDFFWKMAFYLGLVLTLSFFILGFFIFKQVDKESVLPMTNGVKAKIVQKERVIKVLEYFKGQEKKSEEVLNPLLKIADPSL
ncbi:MAG: hypothetical protein WA101_01230 [Minisyncoccia bacterium]